VDVTEARDSEWQWHRPHASLHLAPDRYTIPAPPTAQIFTGHMPFLPPNQQHQSTEATSTVSPCCLSTVLMLPVMSKQFLCVLMFFVYVAFYSVMLKKFHVTVAVRFAFSAFTLFLKPIAVASGFISRSAPGWLDSRVVSVLDSGTEGPGFKSQSRRCRITVLGKLFTPVVPLFTKQQNW